MPKQPTPAARPPILLRIGEVEYEIQVDVRMTPVKRKGKTPRIIGREVGGELGADDTANS